MRSSLLRLWGVALAVSVGLAAFALAVADPSPSRWVGGGMLIALVVVGAGQPIRLLAVALGPVFAGLYAAAAVAFGVTLVTPAFVVGTLALALAVSGVAEMFGRACTAEDERRLSTATAMESLTPTDPLAGVLKWQHAAPLFEREISRAQRLGHDVGFLLVSIAGADELDRRLGPEGAGRTLRAVGDWLQRQCRSTDIVLYRGAGQFGVILPDTSPELVDVVAHRIVDRPDGAAEVALLVGSASFPHDGRDPDDLMRVAAGRLISLAAPPDTGMISERPSTADSGGVTQ